MAELGDRTWPETESLAVDAVLAIPLGATEQHGPHLPLATDTEIAVALVARLAAALPRVVAAPPLAYGSSGEHAGFPGTLSIGAEATERLLVELCRSASESFRQVLVVSTHGGNREPLRRALATLAGEGRDVVAWTPGWRGDAHAGRLETSLMLAIAPRLVRVEAAEPGNTEPLAELLPRLRSDGVRAAAENGVLGDPAGASAAEGEGLLRAAVAELVELATEAAR